jgi:hypothetical protein
MRQPAQVARPVAPSLEVRETNLPAPVHLGPLVDKMEPMAVRLELEQVEALELLGMTLAHLKVAETRVDLSPRVPLLMAIRDKIAITLREGP